MTDSKTKLPRLGRKIPLTRDVLDTLAIGDRVHIYRTSGEKYEVIANVLRSADNDGDVRISGMYLNARMFTHIKILSRAPAAKTTRMHGIDIRVQGADIKINNDPVARAVVFAVGIAIESLTPFDQSLADVVAALVAGGVDLRRGRVRKGCVDVTHEQAAEIVDWIWEALPEE